MHIRNKYSRIFILLIFVTISAQTFFAQKGSKDKITFDVRTNLMVVNDKNEPVNDIKESDVTLYENGVEQKLTYFAQKDSGFDVSILIDNTGSVRSILPEIVSIAKIIISNLNESDEATLIRFVDRKKTKILVPWTNVKSNLDKALNHLLIEGGQSAVNDALYLAGTDILKHQKDSKNKRGAIILISDGEDRESSYKDTDVVQLLADSDVQIFTIALTGDLPPATKWLFGNEKSSESVVKQYVNKIAAQTGGTSFILGAKSTEEETRTALNSIITELHSQFVIGYTARDLTKKTRIRRLTATVADGPNGEKRKAIIKDNIILPLD